MVNPNDKKPHILFLFSDTGGGHRSAARAIIEALEVYYPEQVTTEMLDFFLEYAPPPFDLAVSTYAPMAQVPDLWELGYKLSNGRYRSQLVLDVLWPYVRKRTKDLVTEHPCDMYVAVHPIINTPILRTLGQDHKPYMIVITDMVTTHAFWYNENATLTLSPTEEAKQRGIEIGMPTGSIEVVGQPIADKFCRPPEPKKLLRQQLGWAEDQTIVLLVGGGDGMGPIYETVKAINQANLPLTMAIISGRNENLIRKFNKLEFKTEAKILGFVDNMPDLMNAADIIVTKAGPGTISEAFIAGLPIMLYSRMPGQEEGNVDYVVDKGAGVWAPTPENVVNTLRHWINHPEDRNKIAVVSKSLAKPDASKKIAKRIIDLLYT